MDTDTTNTLKFRLAAEKLNRVNAAMKWSQIASADDPRVTLTRQYNEALTNLTDDEVDYLNRNGYSI